MRPPFALNIGWQTCDVRAASDEAADDVAPCAGVARQPYGRCLAHLGPEERDQVVANLSPGAPLDLRGTPISPELLSSILSATQGVLGRARFDHAHFTGPAMLGRVVFSADASFDAARFDGLASFFGSRFTANVSFGEATFARELTLHEARVQGHASFEGVSVRNDALLSDARFARTASFQRAAFRGYACFDQTAFGADVTFRGARFGRAVSFGDTTFGANAAFEGARFAGCAFFTPALVGRRLTLTGAHAQGALSIDADTCVLDLRRARIMERLTVRIASGQVDLEGSLLRGSATVGRRDRRRVEPHEGRTGGRLHVVSLDDVEAEALTLVGTDLSGCRLSGVHRPDRLRLCGCAFASTPTGLHLRLGWPPLRWWSRRQLLADERVWRGWSPTGQARQDPGSLATLYSHLCEGLDDKRTAADFAFGEMEMRRLAAGHRIRRLMLGVYWLACGYGMRMGRALGWLTLLTVLTAGALWWTAPHSARHPVSHRPVAPAHTLRTIRFQG